MDGKSVCVWVAANHYVWVNVSTEQVPAAPSSNQICMQLQSLLSVQGCTEQNAVDETYWIVKN